MVTTLEKMRLIGGRALLLAGLVVFVMWVKYIAYVQGLPDPLDLSPLVLAVAILALGVWLAPVRGLSALVPMSYERALLLSLGFAVVVEIVFGPVIYHLVINDPIQSPLIWRLEGLQKPGASVGLAIYRHVRGQLGFALGRDLAVTAGFAVMIAMWTGGTFALLSVLRLLRRRRADQQV
jgi:FtsH-binding integral membrane protein